MSLAGETQVLKKNEFILIVEPEAPSQNYLLFFFTFWGVGGRVERSEGNL